MIIVGFKHLGRVIRLRSDDGTRQRTEEVASLRRHHDTLTTTCDVETPCDRSIHRDHPPEGRHTFTLDISFMLTLQNRCKYSRNQRSPTDIQHLSSQMDENKEFSNVMLLCIIKKKRDLKCSFCFIINQ